MHLYACASVAFFCQRRPVYAGTAIEGMVFWFQYQKKRTGSIVAFFGKFPIHQYFVYTTVHAFLTDFTCLSRNRQIPLFLPAQTRLGLQDNITLKTSYAFNLYVYYLRIKRTILQAQTLVMKGKMAKGVQLKLARGGEEIYCPEHAKRARKFPPPPA